MKKFSLILPFISLCLSGCIWGNKKANNTKYYEPTLEEKYEETNKDQFVEQVHKNYIEPKKQYEFVKIEMSQNQPLYYLGEEIKENPVFYGNLNYSTLNGFYGIRADVSGIILGLQADISFVQPTLHSYCDAKNIESSENENILFYQHPYAVKIQESSTLLISYDNSFLPISIHYESASDSTLTRDYKLSYFNENDISSSKGEVNRTTFFEQALPLIDKNIDYSGFEIDVKGDIACVATAKMEHVEGKVKSKFMIDENNSQTHYGEGNLRKTLLTTHLSYWLMEYETELKNGTNKDAILETVMHIEEFWNIRRGLGFNVLSNATIKYESNPFKISYEYKRNDGSITKYHLTYNSQGLVTDYEIKDFYDINFKAAIKYN